MHIVYHLKYDTFNTKYNCERILIAVHIHRLTNKLRKCVSWQLSFFFIFYLLQLAIEMDKYARYGLIKWIEVPMSASSQNIQLHSRLWLINIFIICWCYDCLFSLFVFFRFSHGRNSIFRVFSSGNSLCALFLNGEENDEIILLLDAIHRCCWRSIVGWKLKMTILIELVKFTKIRSTQKPMSKLSKVD